MYRDLKPDNVALYQVEGIRMRAVIIDFGKCLPVSNCVKYSLSPHERQTYRQSHQHVSPDLVDGTSKPSMASDIYRWPLV